MLVSVCRTGGTFFVVTTAVAPSMDATTEPGLSWLSSKRVACTDTLHPPSDPWGECVLVFLRVRTNDFPKDMGLVSRGTETRDQAVWLHDLYSGLR